MMLIAMMLILIYTPAYGEVTILVFMYSVGLHMTDYDYLVGEHYDYLVGELAMRA